MFSDYRRSWLAFLLIFVQQESQAGDLAATVLSEAPKAWAEISKWNDALDFDVRIHGVRKFDGEVYRDQLTIFLQRPDSRLNEMRIKTYTGLYPKAKANSGILICQNPDYAFEIVRKNDSAGWALISVSANKNSREYHRLVDNLVDGRLNMRMPLIFDAGFTVNALFSEPNFRIIKCENGIANGLPCVTVWFENPHEVPAPTATGVRYHPVHSGWVSLYPDKKWSIAAYDLQCRSPNRKFRMFGDASYLDRSDLVLTSRTISKTEIISATDTDVKATEFVQTFEYQFSPPDSEIFRLPHYGLLEPTSVAEAHSTPSRTKTIWFLGGALLCVGVIAMIRRAGGHRSSAAG